MARRARAGMCVIRFSDMLFPYGTPSRLMQTAMRHVTACRYRKSRSRRGPGRTRATCRTRRRRHVDVHPLLECWLVRTRVRAPPAQNTSRAGFGPGQALNLTTQPHLAGTAVRWAARRRAPSRGVHHRLRAQHTTAVLSCGLPGGARVDYICVSPTLSSPGAADDWSSLQVQNAVTLGLSALRAAHEAWWHDWWPAGGFLTTEYSRLESFFFVQVSRHLRMQFCTCMCIVPPARRRLFGRLCKWRSRRGRSVVQVCVGGTSWADCARPRGALVHRRHRALANSVFVLVCAGPAVGRPSVTPRAAGAELAGPALGHELAAGTFWRLCVCRLVLSVLSCRPTTFPSQQIDLTWRRL